MYSTEGLSEKARYKLDQAIYSGIVRYMDSLRFHIEAAGVDQYSWDQLAFISELVVWYCKTVMVSGAYLQDELSKLQRFIVYKSSW